MSESQALPLTVQEYLGLSSHFTENFFQVCKFKAIYLDLFSISHTQNLNKTIHDSIMQGLN